MSKEAIQELVRELELLPETDQRLVLAFLARLRPSRQTREISTHTPSALQKHNGSLVFTGQLEEPDADLVQLTREESDGELMKRCLGRI